MIIILLCTRKSFTKNLSSSSLAALASRALTLAIIRDRVMAWDLEQATVKPNMS